MTTTKRPCLVFLQLLSPMSTGLKKSNNKRQTHGGVFRVELYTDNHELLEITDGTGYTLHSWVPVYKINTNSLIRLKRNLTHSEFGMSHSYCL